MSDDAQESTNDTSPSAPAVSGGGGSILKLLGIAIGLTAIAALGVGIVFWKTLNDSSNQGTTVIEVDPNAPEEDDGLGGGGPGAGGPGAGGPPGAGGFGGPDSSARAPGGSQRPDLDDADETDPATSDPATNETNSSQPDEEAEF